WADNAAQPRVDAESGEVAAGHQFTGDPFRLPADADVQAVAEEAEHRAEHLVVVAQFGEPRVRQLIPFAPAVAVLKSLAGDEDELAGSLDREQPQQQLIDERENGGVRADAEGDR